MFKQKQHEHELQVKALHLKILTLWQARDINGLLALVTAHTAKNKTPLISEDKTMQALERFLAANEAYFEKVRPDDQVALFFLRGTLKLHQQKYFTGFADFERVAWNSHHMVTVPSNPLTRFVCCFTGYFNTLCACCFNTVCVLFN